MRVCIVGAGNVGRSIARELITNGHDVLLIERVHQAIVHEAVDGVDITELAAPTLVR